jgi:hypothetical protein
LLLCWCWEYLALLINEVEVFIRTAWLDFDGVTLLVYRAWCLFQYSPEY